MRWMASWLVAVVLTVAAGCALPKLVLGGSVSLRNTRDATAGHSSVRSALWIALQSSLASAGEHEPEPASDQALEHDEAAPCELEAACAWEREAARDAWIAELSVDDKGEPSP